MHRGRLSDRIPTTEPSKVASDDKVAAGSTSPKTRRDSIVQSCARTPSTKAAKSKCSKRKPGKQAGGVDATRGGRSFTSPSTLDTGSHNINSAQNIKARTFAITHLPQAMAKTVRNPDSCLRPPWPSHSKVRITKAPKSRPGGSLGRADLVLFCSVHPNLLPVPDHHCWHPSTRQLRWCWALASSAGQRSTTQQSHGGASAWKFSWQRRHGERKMLLHPRADANTWYCTL